MSEQAIPDDVMEAAKAAIGVAGFPAGDLPTAVMEEDIRVIVAHAILAERGRCIRTALSFIKYSGEPGAVAVNPYVDAHDIASAIRRGAA